MPGIGPCLDCSRCYGLTAYDFRSVCPAGGHFSRSRFSTMFSLIVIGQTYIPSGLASILNATTPLFTVLVMAAAGDEKLHPRRVAGVVTGLIGVIILHGQDLHGQDLLGTDLHGQDLGIQAGEGIGILLCLAAAFSYGLAALYARRKLSNSPPLATATFQLLASSLMMTIIAAVFERPWQLPMPGANDVAGDDGPRRIVDCAGLYRIFPRVAALGLDQRHAGDASRSGDGYSARLSRAGRKHLAARDRRRPRDRQRAAADRRARAQFRPTRARNSIAPSPTTRARPRPQGREPPLRADAIVRRCGRPSYRNPSGSCVPSCRRWSQRRPSVLYRPVDLRGSLFPCSPHPDDTCRPRLRAGWTSCREARSASPKIFPRHQSQTRHNAGLCLGR